MASDKGLLMTSTFDGQAGQRSETWLSRPSHRRHLQRCAEAILSEADIFLVESIFFSTGIGMK